MTRVNFTCCRDGQTCGQGHSTQRVAEASFQLSVKRNVVTDHRNLLLCDGDLLFGWLGIVKGPLRSGLRLRNWGRAMYCTGFWLVSLPRTMTLSLAVGSSLMPPESNEDFTLPWVGSAGPGPHRAQVFSKPAETGLRSIARGVRRISPRRRWSTQAEKPAKTSQDDCGDQSTGGHDVCPLLADWRRFITSVCCGSKAHVAWPEPYPRFKPKELPAQVPPAPTALITIAPQAAAPGAAAGGQASHPPPRPCV
jgi:hypothetical protein